MIIARLTFIALASIPLFTLPSAPAQAFDPDAIINQTGNATCKDLETMLPSAMTAAVKLDTLKSCIYDGMDPPAQYQKLGGSVPMNTPTGNTIPVGLCKPSNVQDCPNSSRRDERSGAGYSPLRNPNLNLPETPWGKMEDSSLPCGAVGTLSQVALQSLLGNVSLGNMGNMNLGTLAMGAISSVLNSGWANCQDGKFWGILRYLVNLIVPPGTTPSMNSANNSYLATAGSYVALPTNVPVDVDLSTGSSNHFTLPNGGSFNTATGSQVIIMAGDSVQFRVDGSAITGSGQRFRINPSAPISFNPNGLIAITENQEVPIDPNAMLYPMGPITVAPDWLESAY